MNPRAERRATAGVLWALLLICLTLFGGAAASAHEVRPALLRITETTPGQYEVLWKQPTVGDMAVRLSPHLSSGFLDRRPTIEETAPGFRIRIWRGAGPPLDGQTVTIEGLSQSVSETLLQVTAAGGKTLNAVIRPSDPTVTLALSGPGGIAVAGYLRMGVEHILTGFDHLLFVFGLFLLIGANWRLVKAITAFTVAHTITLAAAALGYIQFPSAAIEALVALSIVFVAYELARPGVTDTVARRRPWLIAFTFGLLHGLAFAGALAEVGLPRDAAPQALLLFNLGVEIGQLTFIATVLVASRLLHRLTSWGSTGVPVWAGLAPAYVIGGLSTYWLIDRTLTAIQPPI